MDHITNILWLAEESWGVLCYFWPVTLALLLAAGVASILNFPFTRSRCRSRHFLVFLPLGASLLILIWGSVMRDTDDPSLAVDNWRKGVLLCLWIAQLITGIGVIWIMKGFRWFSTSIVLLEQWIGFACTFVAGMAVTGDWL